MNESHCKCPPEGSGESSSTESSATGLGEAVRTPEEVAPMWDRTTGTGSPVNKEQLGRFPPNIPIWFNQQTPPRS